MLFCIGTSRAALTPAQSRIRPQFRSGSEKAGGIRGLNANARSFFGNDSGGKIKPRNRSQNRSASAMIGQHLRRNRKDPGLGLKHRYNDVSGGKDIRQVFKGLE